MWISLFMVYSFSIFACAAYNFVCKYGWGYQHEDYCYKKFLGTSTTWSNAQSTCRRHGGFLVSIRDQRKQNHIQGLVNGVSLLWTGGNYRGGHWYWDEGDRVHYFNWGIDLPDSPGRENCLSLRGAHSWTWNDAPCSLNRPFICELHACHLPEHCVATTCTNTSDYRCTQCQDEGSTVVHSLYWSNADRKVCEATCSWKENWCWPGTCADQLAKNCACSADFYKYSSNPARCELSKKPLIEVCRLGAESNKGEVGNSTSHGNCEKEESTYINFQPKSLSFKFDMIFHTLKGLPEKPIHIHDYHFGLVHTDVLLYKENIYDLLLNI